MTPPVQMPLLLSVGAQAIQPFHVLSPMSLVAFYLSHFQPLFQMKKERTDWEHRAIEYRVQEGHESSELTPSHALHLGMIPLNWILNQELAHQAHQMNHQPPSSEERLAHEWALLDRQMQESPFSVQKATSWPSKPSQSGEAGPSTDMAYQSKGTLNPFLNRPVLSEMSVSCTQEVPQTPLQQILPETIHQYIWNLMYPRLSRQLLKQTEEPSSSAPETDLEAMDEAVRKNTDNRLVPEI